MVELGQYMGKMPQLKMQNQLLQLRPLFFFLFFPTSSPLKLRLDVNIDHVDN